MSWLNSNTLVLLRVIWKFKDHRLSGFWLCVSLKDDASYFTAPLYHYAGILERVPPHSEMRVQIFPVLFSYYLKETRRHLTGHLQGTSMVSYILYNVCKDSPSCHVNSVVQSTVSKTLTSNSMPGSCGNSPSFSQCSFLRAIERGISALLGSPRRSIFE